MLALVASVVLSAAPATPSPQALVFYNARLALRDDRPIDVLKLWLMRNALVDQGKPGTFDDEFLSVLWAALGNTGLCQDAVRFDDESAGLWPLALHNWVLHAAGSPPNDELPTSFDGFDVSRQLRLVSLHDVLSAEELRSVSFFATPCTRYREVLFDLEVPYSVNLADRLSEGDVLRTLLERSLITLSRAHVEGVSLIEARMFDLDLAIAELEARQARRQGLEAEQRARTVGISKQGAKELRDLVASWPARSPKAAFLRRALSWPVKNWFNLSRARRTALFARARPYAQDRAALRSLTLDIIDELLDRQQGDELEWWVAALDELEGSGDHHRELLAGERGKRLLVLEPSTGFHERATIALHRGVAFLEAGERLEALRAFAFALAHADESKEAGAISALARRWLSFLLAHYETNAEVVSTLRALVPRQDFNAIVEDLVWKAAMRADATSFERLAKVIHRGSALDARVSKLELLAQGQVGALATRLREGLNEEPAATMRFMRTLIEHLEGEDATVRAANTLLLRHLVSMLDAFSLSATAAKSQARTAEEVSSRAYSLLEALGVFDTSAAARPRTVAPAVEAFAGNIRLAPADALPWPFHAQVPDAPTPFAPIRLEPVEWADRRGGVVFGWRLSE